MTPNSPDNRDDYHLIEQILLGNAKNLSIPRNFVNRVGQAITPSARRPIDAIPFIRLMRLIKRFVVGSITGPQFKRSYVNAIKEHDWRLLHSVNDDLAGEIMRIRHNLAMFCASPECRAEEPTLIDEEKLRVFTQESYDLLIENIVDRVLRMDPQAQYQ